jgi:thiosulfate/3-mercaptopyruvate sulfurtransferase
MGKRVVAMGMRSFGFLLVMICVSVQAMAEISIISPIDAHTLITKSSAENKPIVIDTRGGYKDYFRGHLPRAHHLNFDTLRGTDLGVPVQYLPADITVTLLNRAGVQLGKTHIIYATGEKLPNDEILSTSMVAYVLEKYGVTDIRIVDGGLASWGKEGLPVTQEYFGNPAGSIKGVAAAEIGVTVNEVLEAKKRSDVLLIDARPYNEYVGDDDVWLRKGHIPGAISFHWAKLMETDNTHKFESLEKNLLQLESAGITKDKDIIVYCGTSREGSLLRFYLKHIAGYPRVRLYEGSWKEYAAMKELPAEVKPNAK